MEAQEQNVIDNHILVKQMKKEMDVKLEQLEVEKVEIMAEKREIVEQVHSQKDNAIIEMEKVKLENKRIRDEVNLELTEAMQRKKEEDMIDQRKKEELIR